MHRRPAGLYTCRHPPHTHTHIYPLTHPNQTQTKPKVDNTFLDYSKSSAGYAAFGTVTDGMDLVMAISEVKTHTTKGFSDVPKTDIVIESVERTTCADAVTSAKKNLRTSHAKIAPRHAVH